MASTVDRLTAKGGAEEGPSSPSSSSPVAPGRGQVRRKGTGMWRLEAWKRKEKNHAIIVNFLEKKSVIFKGNKYHTIEFTALGHDAFAEKLFQSCRGRQFN